MTLDRAEIKANLARVATPKAMVTKFWDADTQKFGKSSVKVVNIDSEKLDTLRFSDAWVGNDDDVKVGNTHGFPIAQMGTVSSVPEAKVLVIENLMQIQCESTDELFAWVTALNVLKRVCQADQRDNVFETEVDALEEKTPASVVAPDISSKEGEKDAIISRLTQKLVSVQAENDEKDQTIITLSKRLEHSLRMLKAVHGMYEEQQKVLSAQEAVIDEMDGANQAIQSAAGQMKDLIGGGKKLKSQSTTPVHAQTGRPNPTYSAPVTPAATRGLMRKVPQAPGMTAAPGMTGGRATLEMLDKLYQASGIDGSDKKTEERETMAKAFADAQAAAQGLMSEEREETATRNPRISAVLEAGKLAQSTRTAAMNNPPSTSAAEKKTYFAPPKRETSSRPNSGRQPKTGDEEFSGRQPKTGDEELQANGYLSEIGLLMKKISMMKDMLQTVGKDEMAGDAADEVKDEDLPPQDEDEESDDEKAEIKIQSYMDDLTALEEEKANMQEQLASAQDQQQEMISRLEQMKQTMAMFNSFSQTA